MYANVTRERLRMNLSVNPGNDYKGRLGFKTKCYQYVYYWVFRDNYIQQLLKGKDGIVMKRSLYRLINDLRANYWVLIICNNKRPYYHFQFA